MVSRHLDDAGSPDDEDDHDLRCTDELRRAVHQAGGVGPTHRRRTCPGSSGAAIDHGAREQRVADALGGLERGLHAQVLACLDIDVPAIRVWGDEYRRIRRLQSEYRSRGRYVCCDRYRKTGRNDATLDR
jgi:hypothetical protein